MLSKDETLQCWECRFCPGAAYQVPPILYCGYLEAPILVIGQNPGEINYQSNSSHGKKWIKVEEFLKLPNKTADEIVGFYNWDFGESHGRYMLDRIFGEHWLESGRFCYTNAVRCRTPSNQSPSEIMQASCWNWTKRLLAHRRFVVLMGAVARYQVLGSRAAELPWGASRRLKNGVHVMAIRHYAAWRSTAEINEYQTAFSNTLSKL